MSITLKKKKKKKKKGLEEFRADARVDADRVRNL